MALTHLALLILLINLINNCKARPSSSPVISKTVNDSASLDSRRKTFVDDAFLEQKDVLLDMLESKLKEIRDKKKKRERSERSSAILNCDFIKDIELKIKSSGLIAVGEADVSIKYGRSGNTKLNFDASGISNIGKAHVDLGIDDGSLYLPGLSSLFSSFEKICHNNVPNITNGNAKGEGQKMQPEEEVTQAEELTPSLDGRRSGSNGGPVTNASVNTVKLNENTEITIPVQIVMDETKKSVVSESTATSNSASVDTKTSDTTVESSTVTNSTRAVTSDNPASST